MNEQDFLFYAAKAKVIKALAHPTRLWIIEKLASGECCVCVFVDAVNADFSTVSKHLTVLKKAGLVEDEKRGKQVFYRLRIPCVLRFLDCMESILPAAVRELHASKVGKAAKNEPDQAACPVNCS